MNTIFLLLAALSGATVTDVPLNLDVSQELISGE